MISAASVGDSGAAGLAGLASWRADSQSESAFFASWRVGGECGAARAAIFRDGQAFVADSPPEAQRRETPTQRYPVPRVPDGAAGSPADEDLSAGPRACAEGGRPALFSGSGELDDLGCVGAVIEDAEDNDPQGAKRNDAILHFSDSFEGKAQTTLSGDGAASVLL